MSLEDDLKSGLRRLAKAVVVITSEYDGKRYAMAATAVSELSMAPPSMLVCINKSASMAAIVEAGVGFAINILHASHSDICNVCSGAVKGEARFTIGEWNVGRYGMPLLADAQASFECKQASIQEFGTHYIVIGSVVSVTLSESDVEPLVYADGRFFNLDAMNA